MTLHILRKLTITCCILASASFLCHAQSEINYKPHDYGLQYGITAKGTLEFEFSGKLFRINPVFGLNAGAGSYFVNSGVFPSINLELRLYSGGLGSRRRVWYPPSPFNIDLISAFTITKSLNKERRLTNPLPVGSVFQPLYYFSDFIYPALQNPYEYSLSLGTNLIWRFEGGKSPVRQRLGFSNLHLNRLQVSYYNDGTPFAGIGLGDGKDRYYTGGAVISYSSSSTNEFNLVEVSYQKFTGYTLNAFETGNKLDIAFLNYSDPTQHTYNKSVWSINAWSYKNGYNISLKDYNRLRLDAQHLIHTKRYNSFHMVPEAPYQSLSGSYFITQTTLGQK